MKTLKATTARFPSCWKDLVDLKETTGLTPATTSLAEGLPYVGLTADDVQDARARLAGAFAPYHQAQAFPEP